MLQGRLIGLILPALFLLQITLLHAEEIDWKKGRLEHLAPTIGTYRLEEVLSDPFVEHALRQLLPSDTQTTLHDNLQVAGPIDFIGGYLVLSGNRPHQGTEETASVWVNIYDGKVHVILQHYGKFTVYAKETEFYHLPIQLRAKLAIPLEDIPWRQPPPDVTWVGRVTAPAANTQPSPQ